MRVIVRCLAGFVFGYSAPTFVLDASRLAEVGMLAGIMLYVMTLVTEENRR